MMPSGPMHHADGLMCGPAPARVSAITEQMPNLSKPMPMGRALELTAQNNEKDEVCL